MLTIILIVFLVVVILAILFLLILNRFESKDKNDRLDNDHNYEEISEPASTIASDADDSIMDHIVIEPKPLSKTSNEPIVEDIRERTQQKGNAIEAELPLQEINPRDDLSRFIFPDSTIEELSHMRLEENNPDSMKLPIAIGKDGNSSVKIIDLANTPNLLVAGSRACYDSVVRNLKTIVYSLLITKHPSEVKFVLMDAHRLDFMGFDKLINHYLAVLPTACDEEEERANSIVSSIDVAVQVFSSLNKEIDHRLEMLQKARCRNIEQYNEKYRQRELLPTKGHCFLPYLVVVVNEYAEFISLTVRNVQPFIDQIVRIAHKGKVVGVHLVLGTTYILREYIPSELIDCFPGVIAYRVNTWNESKILLGETGAECQVGTDSFIYKDHEEALSLHNLNIPEDEFDLVVEGIGKQIGYRRSFNLPFYLPDPSEESEESGRLSQIRIDQLDERFEEAARLIVTSQRGSTSDLQRRLGMGYAKAGMVMDQLEAAGIVGPQNGSKPREVLVKDFNELDQILSHFLHNSF